MVLFSAELQAALALRVAVGAARAPPPHPARGSEEPPSASSGRPKGGARPVPAERLLLLPAVLARCRRLSRGSGPGPEPPPAAAMPSPTDSNRSLTGRSSRSLTHLRLQRTWLQVLLVLGLVQAILGVLIVTFSLVAATITPSTKIRHSCPSWAGFSVSVAPGAARGGGCTAPRGPSVPPVPGEGSPAAPPPPARACRGALWEYPTASPRVVLRDGDPRALRGTGRGVGGMWGAPQGTTGQGSSGGGGSALSAACWGEGSTRGAPTVTLQHGSWPGFAAQPEQALNQQFLPSCGARAAPYSPAAPGLAPGLQGSGGSARGQGVLPNRAFSLCSPPGLVNLQLALSGLVGIISWKRPLTLVVGVGEDTLPQAGESRMGRPSSPLVPRVLPAPPLGSPAQPGSPSPPAADRFLHAAVGAGRHAEPRRLHPVVPERAAGENPGGLREGEAERGPGAPCTAHPWL